VGFITSNHNINTGDINTMAKNQNSKIKNITQAELKKVVHYDPNTGVFTRIKNIGRTKSGDIAGNYQREGYLRFKIYGKIYFSHRLAWLYVYGYFPENCIDHINRVKDDNRIANLREASLSCNMRNCNVQKKSKSGVTGVFWDKAVSKWWSQITNNKKYVFLGRFNDLSDAVIARLEAEKKYGYLDCNPKSSAYLYLKNKREALKR